VRGVVEDSEITFDDLRAEGFSASVLAALEALTKRPGETRMEAASRARAHPIARERKLAGNAENWDLSRISQPTPKDHARVVEYRKVRAILLEESKA
jgi:hypothetical protein